MTIHSLSTKDIIIRLLVALVIGGLTGLEREKSHQFAGFRTHILVSVGSCITSITSLLLFIQYQGLTNMDPARLSAQVLSGIGFLGAGAILKTSNGIRGLTTAAGIWATACIGISVGYGYYTLSIAAWVFVVLTLNILKYIDILIFKNKTCIINIISKNMNVASLVLEKLEHNGIKVKNMDIRPNEENTWDISFFIIYDRRIALNGLVSEIYALDNIVKASYLL